MLRQRTGKIGHVHFCVLQLDLPGLPFAPAAQRRIATQANATNPAAHNGICALPISRRLVIILRLLRSEQTSMEGLTPRCLYNSNGGVGERFTLAPDRMLRNAIVLH